MNFHYKPSRPASHHATIAAAMVALLAVCAGLDSAAQSASGAAKLSPERIREIVASPDRSEADRKNDVRRKPAEMLTFIGIVPGMVAVDLSDGGGYTTELIARAVGPTGRVYGQSTNPAAPARLAERARIRPPATCGGRPEVRGSVSRGGRVERCRSRDTDVQLSRSRPHGHRPRADEQGGVAALKPGGMYVIADHSGRPGTGISESGTLHRVEEAFVRKEVEAAGFKLVAEGGFLRNPADPRDKETPDPAMPKDEFVLKFVKP